MRKRCHSSFLFKLNGNKRALVTVLSVIIPGLFIFIHGRPNKNNLEYFTHDANMRNDRKIKAVRAKYGITGYAVYNMLLETLCESNLLIINLSDEELELVSGDLTIVSEELIFDD